MTKSNDDVSTMFSTNEEMDAFEPGDNTIIEAEDVVYENVFTSVLPGNRIVDLGYVLKWATSLQFEHSKNCSGILFPYKKVSKGLGLVREIEFKCSQCKEVLRFRTENPNHKRSLINTGAVWGTLAIGSTHGQLEELLSAMDIPPMNNTIFLQIENELEDVWHDQLIKEFENNAREEAEMAKEKGHVDPDGVPYTTVYCDCGWCKRSWGHSYDASSGVVSLTKRHRATNKKETPKEHRCYLNWKGASTAMEADIIVEGFCFAETEFNLRFKTFVADGDSSVFAKIVERVPYGREVRKIECANHCVKNYGKNLHNIKKDTKVNSSARKQLTKKIIDELQKVAQKAIYHRAQTNDEQILREDLRNGPLHVFGHHKICKDYYCKEVGQEDNENIKAIKQSGLYNHIYTALETLLRKAPQLVGNVTTNCVETFMSTAARFIAGKRVNLSTRGSYTRRMYLAGLRYNKSFEWHRDPWKIATEISPGKTFKRNIRRKMRQKEMKSKRSLQYTNPIKSNKNTSEKTKKKHDKDYGPHAIQPEPSEDVIEEECRRIKQKLQVTLEERDLIEKNSKQQFFSDVFIWERKERLTASFFGRVIKRLPHTLCNALVYDLLYRKPFYSPSTSYGKHNEKVAIKRFEQQYNVVVEQSGFFICLEDGCLGASPDGLVGDNFLVEVKCLYSINKLGISVDEAIQRKMDICLEKDINNSFRLKRNHNYYFQVQGQLNITGRQFCYFVVYINDQTDLIVEIIEKDVEKWKSIWYPALKLFYDQCVLQEIVRRRILRDEEVYNPPHILKAVEEKNAKKLLKKNKTGEKKKQEQKTNKDPHITPTSSVSSSLPQQLKTVVVPQLLQSRFKNISTANTLNNIETCGVLLGKLEEGKYIIEFLMIPKQIGTANTCESTNEDEILNFCLKKDLITIGWIHTHPTQGAFLSSVDIHSQLSYQRHLPEAIAIVYAASIDTFKCFSLTPEAITYLSTCYRTGFHDHDVNFRLFEEASHIERSKCILSICDLRTRTSSTN